MLVSEYKNDAGAAVFSRDGIRRDGRETTRRQQPDDCDEDATKKECEWGSVQDDAAVEK